MRKMLRSGAYHCCVAQGKQALRVYHPYSCSTLDKPTCTTWHPARAGTRTHHAKQAEQDCARRSLRSSAEMRARLASRNTVWGLVFQEYHRSKGRAWGCAYLLQVVRSPMPQSPAPVKPEPYYHLVASQLLGQMPLRPRGRRP